MKYTLLPRIGILNRNNTFCYENSYKIIDLKEDDCRIINNLFSEKLCNTADHFYSTVFIFLSPKGSKKYKLTLKYTQPHYTSFR